MFSWLKIISLSQSQEADHVVRAEVEREAQPNISDNSILYKTQGDVYLNQELWQEAANSYKQAISIKPEYAEAYINLGNAFRELNQFDEAELALKQAITIKPDLAYAYYNLASVQIEQQRFGEAIINFKNAIQLNSDEEVMYRDLCFALIQAGQYQDAKNIIIEGLVKFPNYVHLHFYLGNLYLHEKLYEKAVSCYQKALEINPEFSAIYPNLGKAYHGLGMLKEALEYFSQSVLHTPNKVEALCDQGTILSAMHRPEESLSSYDTALRVNPEHADTWCYRGNALKQTGRYDEALLSYSKAIQINPQHGIAWSNRGILLSALKRNKEALLDYERALIINPDHADAHFNRSICRLATGDFENGWQEHEWRFDIENYKGIKRLFTQPLWLGQHNIEGKTILIYSEQGLGDTIQFSRYTSLIASLGASVLLEVQSPLISLLRNLGGVSKVINKGDALPDFDFHCPLLSLPLAFKTEMETIPSRVPYITHDTVLADHYQTVLEGISGPRIGIVWSGTDLGNNDWSRSVPLVKFLNFASTNLPTLISLQKEARAQDQSILESNKAILHFGDKLLDFSDTAALISCMDIIITIDTSVAHLAGAMNKPVFILLPYSADWRWFLDRSDSPWYPSARLFRQTSAGDWDSVIEKVNMELRAFLQVKSR
jgi:tetratricopeptide (TPR) repeat protein